jgi:DNA-binding transcriptional MocR family regulator
MKKQAGALLSSIHIDRGSNRKIGVQLYMGLRDIILSGGLSAGDRLPATRTLAKELMISRTTVIDAIDRLTAEGILVSRVGAGTLMLFQWHIGLVFPPGIFAAVAPKLWGMDSHRGIKIYAVQ